MSTPKRIPGPYWSESGDYWVAVEDASYLDARRHVKAHAYHDADMRLAYEGRAMAWLCAEEPCWEEHTPECRHVMAYHFREEYRW